MINDAVSLAASGTQIDIMQTMIKSIADTEKQMASILEQALLTVTPGSLGGNLDITA